MDLLEMRQLFIALLAFSVLATAAPHTHGGFFMNYATGADYPRFST